jgi:hypothetical protein
MNIKPPLWLLRRLVKRNPWLLASSGVVKQSLIVEFLFWEFTLDTEMELSSSERERLIAEREAAGG